MMNTFPVGSLADVNPEAALAPSLSAQQVLATSAPQLHAWAADPVQRDALRSAVASMNAEQVAQLSEGQVSALGDNLMGEVAKGLTNADLVKCIASSGPAGLAMLRATTPARIKTLHPTEFNGLLTSRHDAASVMLNPGAPGAWSEGQFRAMLSKSMGDLPPRVLGNVLSAQALQSLTQADIVKLSGPQLRALLANPVLSKIIFNAGGKGGWTAGQLQALTPNTVAQMNRAEFSQFVDASVFTPDQRRAVATQASNTTVSLDGLPGGGGVPTKIKNTQSPDYYGMLNVTKIKEFLLSDNEQAFEKLEHAQQVNLVMNPHMREALTQLVQENPLILGSRELGFLYVGIREVSPGGFNGIITQKVVDELVDKGEEGFLALSRFAAKCTHGLPVNVLSSKHVQRIIDEKSTLGLRALENLTTCAPDSFSDNVFNRTLVKLLAAQGEAGLRTLDTIAHCENKLLDTRCLPPQYISRLFQDPGAVGIEILMSIANFHPLAMPVGVITGERVDALIAAGPMGYQALGLLVLNARASLELPIKQLTEAQVDRLVQASSPVGQETLATIVRVAPRLLPNGRLTEAQVDALIARGEEGITTLVHISESARKVLPDGKLNMSQINQIKAAGQVGLEALEKLKISVPDVLP